jgi:hypothetical protein
MAKIMPKASAELCKKELLIILLQNQDG